MAYNYYILKNIRFFTFEKEENYIRHETNSHMQEVSLFLLYLQTLFDKNFEDGILEVRYRNLLNSISILVTLHTKQ